MELQNKSPKTKSLAGSQEVFDPNGIFGLSFDESTAKLILLGIEWDLTTSYGKGASQGPQLIFQASHQVDLYDLETKEAYQRGIFYRPLDKNLKKINAKFQSVASRATKLYFQSPLNKTLSKTYQGLLAEVNQACESMVDQVYIQTLSLLRQGKKVGLVGGDHSVPLGYIKALAKHHGSDFSILHIDAHADLRQAYQGFNHSHASIMNNVMTASWAPEKLVQVGIRDFSKEEFDFIQAHPKKIETFFDLNLKYEMNQGKSWDQIAEEMIGKLGDKVYISFDIDGLDPTLCPNTGTPVPGGLQFSEVLALFKKIIDKKKKIIGFDLNEVSTGGLPFDKAKTDGVVGARLLYKLSTWMLSQN